jgi:hypothetical protein
VKNNHGFRSHHHVFDGALFGLTLCLYDAKTAPCATMVAEEKDALVEQVDKIITELENTSFSKVCENESKVMEQLKNANVMLDKIIELNKTPSP